MHLDSNLQSTKDGVLPAFIRSLLFSCSVVSNSL